MAMLHLLKIRTSIDIFKNEKCKVTFGLEYRFRILLCNIRGAIQKFVDKCKEIKNNHWIRLKIYEYNS